MKKNEKKPPRFFLLGWDAADWQVINPLIDAGEMPFLQGLIERGVMGNLATLRPVLSPMLWNSIATGKRADQHGILGFSEVDEGRGRVVPSLSTSRNCKALWNITSQNGLRTNVVGWFASHPAEPVYGVCISEMLGKNVPKQSGADWPLPAGTVHPPELAANIDNWRLRPEELDENVLGHFVPELAKVDQEKDPGLSMLARLLCEAFSTHAATVQVMEEQPWDFMAAYYIAIDHFCHSFMHYHPPRMANVDEEKFALYHDVVRSAYRLHDLFLGRLLAAVGEDCYVMLISDHGFRSDHLRPPGTPRIPAGPAEWHRDHGIFCLAGPGIRRDGNVHGATLLDVAPTVLHAFGLPVGRDMEGKVLAECWEEPSPPHYIDSWETVPGKDGRHPADTGTLELSDADALMEQFIALGYVEKPDEDNNVNLERTRREQKWNLARVYLEKGQTDRALPLLEDVYEAAAADHRKALDAYERLAATRENEGNGKEEETPARAHQPPSCPRPDIAYTLARCYLSLGDLDQAEQILAPFVRTPKPTSRALLLGGQLRLARGDASGALRDLAEAEHLLGDRGRAVAYDLGMAYRRLRRWKRAGACFQRAREWDPSSAPASTRLAESLVRQRRFEEAVDAALEATQCDFNFALGHHFLGVALSALPGHEERAEEALRMSLRLSPGHLQSHRFLCRLHRRRGEERLADEQEREMRALLNRHRREKRSLLDAAVRHRRRGKSADAEAARARAGHVAREFVIVSGLPRSGTSLMMSMLEAGGIEPMTDQVRKADGDNPLGYYEWEAVKKLGRSPQLIEHAEGKAVKVVSPLLRALPAYHRYKVIFMMRPIDEVLASQEAMRHHRGTENEEDDAPNRAELLEKHRDGVLLSLHNLKRFDVLEIDYPELVRDPSRAVTRLSAFLGRNLDFTEMTARVRPELHRQKADYTASAG